MGSLSSPSMEDTSLGMALHGSGCMPMPWPWWACWCLPAILDAEAWPIYLLPCLKLALYQLRRAWHPLF